MVKRPNRVTLGMPEELKRQARAKAIAKGLNLSEVVNRFLKAWLAGEIELPVESKRRDRPPENE